MRKLFITILSLLLFSSFAYASKVNLTKTGTPWVWRVEDGSDGSSILMEDGSYAVSEASARLLFESSDVTDIVIESGAALVYENGNYVLAESSTNPSQSTMLYRALVGQGWEVTDSPATLPQAIQGTDAANAYDLLVMESGSHLLLENTNTIRLEN